jgi:hypothetical protein
MVKYLAIAAALGFSLLAANSANAWGRHGCASCGGCPGGVCSVPVAPGKYTTYGNAPPGLVRLSSRLSPLPPPLTTPARPGVACSAGADSATVGFRSAKARIPFEERKATPDH